MRHWRKIVIPFAGKNSEEEIEAEKGTARGGAFAASMAQSMAQRNAVRATSQNPEATVLEAKCAILAKLAQVPDVADFQEWPLMILLYIQHCMEVTSQASTIHSL